MSHCHYCGEELFSDDQIDSGYCGLDCLERDDYCPEEPPEPADEGQDYEPGEGTAWENHYGFDYSWELER